MVSFITSSSSMPKEGSNLNLNSNTEEFDHECSIFEIVYALVIVAWCEASSDFMSLLIGHPLRDGQEGAVFVDARCVTTVRIPGENVSTLV